MLDISFYANNDQPSYSVEVTENFYEWLAKSEFSKIGKSVARKIKIEGEEEKRDLVQLSKGNRKKFKDFFSKAIVHESMIVRDKLGDSPSVKEYQAENYRLWKLQDLLKGVENEKYQYLQRV